MVGAGPVWSCVPLPRPEPTTTERVVDGSPTATECFLETIARALSDGSFALTHSLPAWLSALFILGGTAVVALFLHSLAFHVLRFALDGWVGEFGRRLLKQIAAPSRLGLLVVALALAV